jgi:8-oxo-dGTP diphosphatase
MTVYLLRHARAGERRSWKGDDAHRPLSKVGRRQAQGLVDMLTDAGIHQILSSHYVRCVQSVEPLAHRLGVPVEIADELQEGAPLDEVLRLIEKVSDRKAVLCTHGDVVLELLKHLKASGVKIGKPRMEKGSFWALETRGGVATKATYHPAPKS